MDSELDEEQQAAVKHWLVDVSCLIARQKQALHDQYPELQLQWDFRVAGVNGERSWLGSMTNMEDAERDALFNTVHVKDNE